MTPEKVAGRVIALYEELIETLARKTARRLKRWPDAGICGTVETSNKRLERSASDGDAASSLLGFRLLLRRG